MLAENNPWQFSKYKRPFVIRNGSTVYVRPIQRSDVDRLLSLTRRFSRETMYLRFHHVVTKMSREEAIRFCTIDYDHTFALVVTVGEGDNERLLAVARYYRLPSEDSAEFAIVVADRYQKQGIGTHLMQELADAAKNGGIRYLQGDVLVENKEMMHIIESCGFQVAEELEEGVYRATLDLHTYR
ncbi:MAG: GNAT family N-acetyltransferase [Dehalococcoidia bacterium]|jgi:acetyltransferase